MIAAHRRSDDDCLQGASDVWAATNDKEVIGDCCQAQKQLELNDLMCWRCLETSSPVTSVGFDSGG
jgi:hypothetical protein